jgi:hypothetical protein
MGTNNQRKNFVIVILATILIVGGVCLEIVNAVTARDAIAGLIRDKNLAIALAIALISVDIGALIYILTPKSSGKDNANLAGVLAVAWLIVASVDTLLSWWSISLVIETNGAAAPAMARGAIAWIPSMLAIVILFLRMLMLYSLGTVLGKWINAGGEAPLVQFLKGGHSGQRAPARVPITRPSRNGEVLQEEAWGN